VRPDEHEGQLSDPKVQRAAQIAEKRARQIRAEDMHELRNSVAFKRWFQSYYVPRVLKIFKTNNGSELQDYNGQKNLLAQMQMEFEEFEPGFLEDILEVRRKYEQSLIKEQ
jgi:hypothetical protein